MIINININPNKRHVKYSLIYCLIISQTRENWRELNKNPAKPQMGFLWFLLISLRISCVWDMIRHYVKLYFTCHLLRLISFFHLPSSIFHLPPSIFHLPSSVFHLPIPHRTHPCLEPKCMRNKYVCIYIYIYIYINKKKLLLYKNASKIN